MKRIGDGRFMRALTFRRQFFANAAIAASRIGRSSKGHACQLDWPVGSPLRASRVLFAKAAFQILEREVIVDQEVF